MTQKITLSQSSFTYPTNFGDPEFAAGSPSAYSRITCTLPIHRDGVGNFFKLFTALFVSTAVAMIALFIRPTEVDPRFGLAVGGLFGIVASSYAVSSALPDSSGLCYADKLHVAGLVCVLVTVVESAFSLSLHLNHGESGVALAKRLDRVTFGVLAVGFVATVAALTISVAT